MEYHVTRNRFCNIRYDRFFVCKREAESERVAFHVLKTFFHYIKIGNCVCKRDRESWEGEAEIVTFFHYDEEIISKYPDDDVRRRQQAGMLWHWRKK